MRNFNATPHSAAKKAKPRISLILKRRKRKCWGKNGKAPKTDEYRKKKKKKKKEKKKVPSWPISRAQAVGPYPIGIEQSASEIHPVIRNWVRIYVVIRRSPPLQFLSIRSGAQGQCPIDSIEKLQFHKIFDFFWKRNSIWKMQLKWFLAFCCYAAVLRSSWAFAVTDDVVMFKEVLRLAKNVVNSTDCQCDVKMDAGRKRRLVDLIGAMENIVETES